MCCDYEGYSRMTGFQFPAGTVIVGISCWYCCYRGAIMFWQASHWDLGAEGEKQHKIFFAQRRIILSILRRGQATLPLTPQTALQEWRLGTLFSTLFSVKGGEAKQLLLKALPSGLCRREGTTTLTQSKGKERKFRIVPRLASRNLSLPTTSLLS